MTCRDLVDPCCAAVLGSQALSSSTARSATTGCCLHACDASQRRPFLVRHEGPTGAFFGTDFYDFRFLRFVLKSHPGIHSPPTAGGHKLHTYTLQPHQKRSTRADTPGSSPGSRASRDAAAIDIAGRLAQLLDFLSCPVVGHAIWKVCMKS